MTSVKIYILDNLFVIRFNGKTKTTSNINLLMKQVEDQKKRCNYEFINKHTPGFHSVYKMNKLGAVA